MRDQDAGADFRAMSKRFRLSEGGGSRQSDTLPFKLWDGAFKRADRRTSDGWVHQYARACKCSVHNIICKQLHCTSGKKHIGVVGEYPCN